MEFHVYSLTANSLKIDFNMFIREQRNVHLDSPVTLDTFNLENIILRNTARTVDQCISCYKSPLGNSCGVTSSLKNSCAMLGCSTSASASINQNWRVLCSCVCFPVCALTRNTLNCKHSWAGCTSPFVTATIGH